MITNKITKILLLAAVGSIIILAISFLGYELKQQKIKKILASNEIAKNALVNEINDSIGGEIIEDSFTLEYLDYSGDISVLITENPYEENKKKALRFIQSKGINVDYENIVFYPGKGVGKQEEGGTCQSDGSGTIEEGAACQTKKN